MAPAENAARLTEEAARLFARYLFAIALDFTSSVEDAEDLVNLAYFNYFQQLLKGPIANPKAWLATVVRNAAISMKRKASRHKQEAQEVFGFVQDHREADPSMLATTADLIEYARSLLSDCEYQIVRMRHHDLKYREIAMLLNMPITTIQNHYQNAIRKLRQELAGWPA